MTCVYSVHFRFLSAVQSRFLDVHGWFTHNANMMSSNTLPFLFEKRWQNGNFKDTNKFSEHDNYNLIQNFGEYLDTGYGKRFIEDKIHKSNEVFISDKPFVKREATSAAPAAGDDSKKLMRVKSCLLTNFHGRFPRNHVQKINNGNKEENGNNLELYLLQKEKTLPPNSLNFESELFQKPRPANLIATEPYRRACNFPWKYSFKTIDYQKCTEQFRRVRTACIDLSKY